MMPAKCCKDFWARIEDDVPVFTLVGWDSLATETINLWIVMAHERGVNEAKIAKAQEHVDAMVKWQSEHPDRVKLPD